MRPLFRYSGNRRGGLRSRGRTQDETPGILVGTSGFEERRAEYIAAFPLLEVKKSFLEPPEPETAERWRRNSPEAFEFTLCAWQLITHPTGTPGYKNLRRTTFKEVNKKHLGHFQPSEEVFEAWDIVHEVAEILDAMAIVFETPASFTPTEAHRRDMQTFFDTVRPEPSPDGRPLLVWEPRGQAWTDDVLREWCEAMDLVPAYDPFTRDPRRVGSVLPGSDVLKPERLQYFRVRGPGGYRHRFTPDDLDDLWLRCGRVPTLCVFRNISAHDDAQSFVEMVERRATP